MAHQDQVVEHRDPVELLAQVAEHQDLRVADLVHQPAASQALVQMQPGPAQQVAQGAVRALLVRSVRADQEANHASPSGPSARNLSREKHRA